LNITRIMLARRPVGLPQDDDFRWETVELPPVGDGQVLVDTLYLSVDPYMRDRMSEGPSYAPPQALGIVIAGTVLGRVRESRDSNFQPGELVLGGYGWQTGAVVPAASLRHVDTGPLAPTAALGVLGSTGVTGYLAMVEVGRPKPHDTVVVSAAAGAVGLVAAQTARNLGARVVGIAGSDAKCTYLTQHVGLEGAVNYKASDFTDQLDRACAQGVDVYFDNVGGPVTDAVLDRINRGARIAVCGQISQHAPAVSPPSSHLPVPTILLNHGATMQGFMVMNYASQAAAARATLARWVNDGQLVYTETTAEGFHETVAAFRSLFTGGNIGKQLVKVAD